MVKLRQRLWGGIGVAAVLAGCGRSSVDVTEQSLRNPNGQAELVHVIRSGGGAAGFVYGEWFMRLHGFDGMFPMGAASHAPDFPSAWTSDRTLTLCMPSAMPREVILEGVEAQTAHGKVEVAIRYQCPESQGAPAG